VKNRGDEPIWVITHIFMEMSQGNCLCSYLKQTKMSFFFSKSGNGRAEWVLSRGLVPVGGRMWGEGVEG
jgi:hypothetical protein